jgi:hypothetical protein
VRGILLKGASIGVLLDEVAAIAAFMTVALLIAIATFPTRPTRADAYAA